MKIEVAKMTDEEQIVEILNQAARRIQSKGSAQWQHILAGEEWPILREHLRQKEVGIGKVGNKIAGVFYLYTQPTEWDDTLWHCPVEPATFYLHKLALADEYTGNGNAERLLGTLQKQLMLAHPQPKIRLDCMSEKKVLVDLYARASFKKVGEVMATTLQTEEHPFTLYEWSPK